MIKKLLLILLFYSIFLPSFHSAHAKELSFFGYEGEAYGPKSPAFTFSGGFGNYLFGSYSKFQSTNQRLRNMWQYSMRAGFAAHPNFEIEGLLSYAPTLNIVSGVSQNVWVYHYGLNFLGQIPGLITPYAIVGLGGMSFDGPVTSPIHKFTVNYGGGFKIFIGKNLALRPEAFATTSFQRLDTAFYGNLLLTYYIGRHKQETPAIGDRDGDGLNDKVDQCPDQPETYNQFKDEDGCPDTVENEKKEEPLKDTDGDGIPDFSDQCITQPETKNGYRDEDGCPDELPKPEVKDTDGDGIPDDTDACITQPETQNGYKDEDGCPDTLPRDLQEFTGPIEGIHFNTNSAIIKDESYPILENATSVFKKYKDVRILIEGHTDSTASNAYNMKLSKERAESVRQYLISRGIAPNRILIKGYGEEKPVASNATPAGRYQNRRIEFKLLGATQKIP